MPLPIHDKMTPEEIIPLLKTKIFGKQIYYEESTFSTQILAHQLAKQGLPEGTIVIAEEQLQGRGRQGKVWYSPPKTGIWMSLILRPAITIVEAPQMSLLAAVGVYQALKKTTGLPVQIKYPNDLFLHKKKICGILTELRGQKGQVGYIVLGIGINVNGEIKDFPPALKPIATSLFMEMGQTKNIHRATLASEVIRELEEVYKNFLTNGFMQLKEKWLSISKLLEKKITVQQQNTSISGIVVGLNENGALLLQTENGILPIISTGMDNTSS